MLNESPTVIASNEPEITFLMYHLTIVIEGITQSVLLSSEYRKFFYGTHKLEKGTL